MNNMTEILEKVKQKIEQLNQRIETRSGENFHDESKTVLILGERLGVYEDLLPDISSLITTIESHAKANETWKESLQSWMLQEARLIKQIESQKEEIEKLRKPAIHLAYTVLKQKHERDAESFIEHINGLEKQIESLKAITELAVKGFKDINVAYMQWIDSELDCDISASKMDNIAEDTLSEIEKRLKNE